MTNDQIEALFQLSEQLPAVNGYLMWVDPEGGHHRVKSVEATPTFKGKRSYFAVTSHTRVYLYKAKASEFRTVVTPDLG